jgi:uncharacterized membrane protein
MSNLSTTVKAIILLAIILATTIAAVVIAQTIRTVPSSGEVVEQEDVQITPAEFDWGELTRGENKTITAQISNMGEEDIQLIIITFNTPIGISMKINSSSTDYPNYIHDLDVGDTIAVNFTITIALDAPIGAFTHDISLEVI